MPWWGSCHVFTGQKNRDFAGRALLFDKHLVICCSKLGLYYILPFEKIRKFLYAGDNPLLSIFPLQNDDEGKYYKYSGWWYVWWTGTYSMVLSKAAFFHNKYLTLYTNGVQSSIRQFITKNRNCEDIAMSFLAANATCSSYMG
ncbi:PREDICTED: glycosyltransferase family 64 protein C4 isoform X1 [Tarenaya hassleriana]|uniref:glycosyltransferase family 64 protein C4 isoform X1 n=1 Tax=Tarenaya hassleriana TaxID=28532 RepID=UPI0008FD0C6D|nr:PREDICTED: glycosyltransferase family 64 protein C4 isoform X1 [Tarenaya hassleriana]